jgi:hypothetical protein
VGLLHTECQRWGQIHNENYVYLLMLHYKSCFKFLVLKFVDSIVCNLRNQIYLKLSQIMSKEMETI